MVDETTPVYEGKFVEETITTDTSLTDSQTVDTSVSIIQNKEEIISHLHQNDEYNIQNLVIPSAVCSLDISKNNGWFNDNDTSSFFGNNEHLKKIENRIKTTTDDFLNGEKPFELCTTNEDFSKGYENCAITSPWRTLNKENEKCQIKEGKCPPSFEFKEGKCVIPLKNMEYFQREKIGFCETKWYDWYSIPNYHLNNKYQKFLRKGKQNLDVSRCFKPCKLGEIPYNVISKNDYDENHNKCILKKDANFGLYSKNNYCPIAVVLLLGTDKEKLAESYNNLKLQHINKITKDIENKILPSHLEYEINDNNDTQKIIDEAFNEIVYNAKEYVMNSETRIDDLKKPIAGDIEFDKCIKLGNMYELLSAYDICSLLTNETQTKELKEKIKAIYNYQNETMLNKHMDLLQKACSKCFEIKQSNSFFKIQNNDYANETLFKLNGEFSRDCDENEEEQNCKKKPLKFDIFNTNYDDVKKEPIILFQFFDIFKIFGNYSNTSLQFSRNSFYDLPNIMIYIFTIFMIFILLFSLSHIIKLLYPIIVFIIYTIIWFLIIIINYILSILGIITVIPIIKIDEMIKYEDIKNQFQEIINKIFSKK